MTNDLFSSISLAHDRASLRQLAHAHYFSSALYAAVTLGLPEALAGGPRTTEQLAAELQTDPDATARLIGFLISLGVLEAGEGGACSLSPTGRLLCADHPESLAREVAMFAGGETHRAWGDLVETMRTGRAAFEIRHGVPLYRYLAENPEAAGRFHRAWQEITTTCARQAVEACDFDGIRTVTDIGGGYGIFLATVLSSRPELRGVLFDLPFSVEGAPANLRRAGVEDRVRILTGDASRAVPPLEFAVLKSVLHGCDDAQAGQILGNVARALPRGGRAVVIERVIPDDPGYHWSRLVDMTMMVMTGGRERTRVEYQRLYSGSGLTLTRCIELPCGFSLIEGVA